MSLRCRALFVLAACSLLTACTRERADLAVELPDPYAYRFLVHGNCFVSWYVSVDMVVQERRGVDVALDGVSVRVVDDRTGLPLGAASLDADALREQLHAEAVVRGRQSLRIPLSVPLDNRSSDAPAFSGFIVATGDVMAHDEDGMLRTSFRLPAAVRIQGGPLPGGACPVP
jgi:hypothetical protein